MKMVMVRATSVNKDVGAQKPEEKKHPDGFRTATTQSSHVVIGASPAETVEPTCSQDREEVKPDEGDDGRRQSLIDGSQVDAAFDASGQVGKVQVVFVHQVPEHHVEEACDGEGEGEGEGLSGCGRSKSRGAEEERGVNSPKGAITGQMML